MVFSLPSSSSGSFYSISLTPPVGSSLTTSIRRQSRHTPVLSFNASSLNVPGNNSLTFTKTGLLSADPAYVEVYSLFNGA